MDERPTSDQTRREGVEALSITLADGDAWGLALPSPRFRPKVIEGVDSLGRRTETIQVISEFGYPLEIRRLVDDLRCSCEQETADRQYEALIRLAVALIRRAHNIDLTEAASLLELGGEDIHRLVDAVLSVVTGECFENSVALRKSDVDG